MYRDGFLYEMRHETILHLEYVGQVKKTCLLYAKLYNTNLKSFSVIKVFWDHSDIQSVGPVALSTLLRHTGKLACFGMEQ